MDKLKNLFKGKEKIADGEPALHDGVSREGDTQIKPSTSKEEPVVFRYGWGDPIFEDENPTVDIIAIHGLNGDRIETWTDETTGLFWLAKLLPETLKEAKIRARILSYGYNADTHSRDVVSVQDLWGHGEAFLGTLVSKRRIDETSNRPIVFIVHSLGGLILKNALIMSNASTPTYLQHNKALKLSTHGIIFCGVPHQGGNGAELGKIMLNIASIATFTTTKIVRILEPSNEVLKVQRDSYTYISDDFYTVPLFETEPTPVGLGMTKLIVSRDSAVLPGQTGRKYSTPIGLDGKNHRTMVKFSSSKDPAYVTLSTQLILMLKESYKGVNDNWDRWKRDLKEEAHSEGRLRPVIPYEPTPRFCGREAELKTLEDALKLASGKDRPRKVIAIHGEGGTGKTEIVLKYQYDHSAEYTSILWVNATSQHTAEAAFVDALTQLISIEARNAPGNKPDFDKISRDLDVQGLVDHNGLVNLPDDDADSMSRIINGVKKWLARPLNKNWLLIFDNHDAMDFDLRGIFFPKCSWGTILITSRRPDIKSYATIPLVFPNALDGLDKDSAIALLLSISGRDGSDNEVQTQAQAIVEALCYLPLAIDQAAAYIALRPQMLLQTYLVRYETMAKELLGNNEHKYPSYKLTCMTTWEMSQRAIREKSRAAAGLLQVCAFFSNDDIWGMFLRRSFYVEDQLQSESQIDDYLAEIYSYHLIRPKLAADTFSMHAVVSTWARERLDPMDRMFSMTAAAQMMGAALHYVNKHGKERSTEELYFEKRMLPHMESFMRVNGSVFGPAALRKGMEQTVVPDTSFRERVLSMVDSVLATTGLELLELNTMKDIQPSILVPQHHYFSTNPIDPKNYGRSVDLQKIVQEGLIPIADAFSRLDRPKASIKINLALMYYMLSFLHGDFIAPIVTRVINIATSLEALDRLAGAEKLYRFALAEWPPSHPDREGQLRRLKRHLAVNMSKSGNYEQANKLYSELRLEEEGRDDEVDAQKLADMSLRGVHLLRIGEYEKAETLHREVLRYREKLLGIEHVDTLVSLNSLAMSLEKQNKLPEAESLHRKALSYRQAILPAGHKDICRSMNNLAVTLENQGNLDEAMALYTEALKLHNDTGGTNSEALLTQKNLGLLQAKKKDFAAAERNVRKSAEGLAKTLGVGHPMSLQAMADLAIILRDMNRLDMSRDLFLLVIKARIRDFRQDSALATSIDGIKSLVERFKEKGDLDKAKSLSETEERLLTELRLRNTGAAAT